MFLRLPAGVVLGVACALIILGGAAEAAQPGRVALVIGNSNYREAPLKNPQNDAKAMAAALRDQGFEVILRQNANKTDMERAIADFGDKLSEGATGLFYYAGHGMQVSGRNFLIPVDAQITSEQRVRLETLDVDVVLDQMAAAKSRVNVVILDACRNNPFERRFRSTGGGLAQINAPEGTLIAYATSPGKVAADGDGDNGLYTEELLKAVRQPGLKVEDVFKTVRVGVTRRSNGAQTPWEASSLVGDFYFKDKPVEVAVAAPALPPAPVIAPAPAIPAQSLDLAFWDAVKGSSDPAEMKAYLDQFPTGTFAALARVRMAALSAPKPAPAPPIPVAAPMVKVEPAPVVMAAPASPAAKPDQQAALPPATAPMPAGTFDGRYETSVVGPRGALKMLIDVEGARITGFTTGTGDCRVTGAIDGNGAVRRMEMSCPSGNRYQFSGQFRVDPATGAVRGETTEAGGFFTPKVQVFQK